MKRDVEEEENISECLFLFCFVLSLGVGRIKKKETFDKYTRCPLYISVANFWQCTRDRFSRFFDSVLRQICPIQSKKEFRYINEGDVHHISVYVHSVFPVRF